MAEQINLGDLVTYHGIATSRAMRRCSVVMVHGGRPPMLSLRFPDGAVIGALRTSCTKILAPQHEPDF